MFGGGWLMMIALAFFWLLLIAGVILVVIWLATRYGGPAAGGRETPLDILKRRYANGEISREEYERMRRELS
jgi:putative membrane protein